MNNKKAIFSISFIEGIVFSPLCVLGIFVEEKWGPISLWLWLASPWWLVTLSIFSCVHLAIFTSSLEHDLFRSSPHFLKSDYLFSWCWAMWVLCICWILTLYQMYHLISSPPNEIWFLHEKAGSSAICDNIDETGGHYSKWNKPEREKQMLYNLSYILKLIS